MNIDQIQSILGAEIECGIFESVVLPALDVCRKIAAEKVRSQKPVWVHPDDLAKARAARHTCSLYPAAKCDLVPLYRAASSAAIVSGATSVQEPVAWIRMDHLRQAQQAPFLCRVEPNYRAGFDLVPICLAATSKATTTAEAQDERIETTSEHIARDIREGRFPQRSEPQMVSAASSATPLTSDSDAVRDVLAERQRQMSVEGWTPEHDDEHDSGQLAGAASCYAAHVNGRRWVFFAGRADDYKSEPAPDYWPWDESWWKPTTPRRDLVKAGALILAEIERIDRASVETGEAT